MKNMLYGAMLSVALLSVAACVSQPAHPLTVHQRYEQACVSAGTAYGVIAAVNDVRPLKASQQQSVLDAKARIDKRCKLAAGEDYPYSATEAIMSELEASAAILKKIKEELR